MSKTDFTCQRPYLLIRKVISPMYINCTSQVKACSTDANNPRISKAVTLTKISKKFLSGFCLAWDLGKEWVGFQIDMKSIFS